MTRERKGKIHERSSDKGRERKRERERERKRERERGYLSIYLWCINRY